jgi:hypothetical protein
MGTKEGRGLASGELTGLRSGVRRLYWACMRASSLDGGRVAGSSCGRGGVCGRSMSLLLVVSMPEKNRDRPTRKGTYKGNADIKLAQHVSISLSLD